jgi:hypothetical protein
MLLVVSLDSESLPWLDEHIESGDLPNLRALIRGGKRAPMEAAVLPGLAYPTLYSGREPADLGLYFPVQWCAERQESRPWQQFPQFDSIFEAADREGIPLVALDPPECIPPVLKHGFAMSGLQFRARVLLHSWSTDADRAKKLLRELGPASRADEVFGQPTAGELRRLRTALLQAPDRLARAALNVLRNDRPECLWITCCALHVGAHQFYDLALLKNPSDRSELAGTRLDIARGYDRMLGDLMGALPAGSGVLLFYGKGMTAAHGWSDLLPAMLRRVLGQPERQQRISTLRRMIPRTARRLFADRMSDEAALSLMARLWGPHEDWEHTRAFCLPTDSIGFIRVNLRGRESRGVVPADDMPSLTAEIREGLSTFVDDEGRKCITAIATPEELMGSGRHTADFPDLFVFWNSKPNLLATGVHSPRFGQIRRTSAATGRSGYHGPGAMAVLSPGSSHSTAVAGTVHLEDIPASILSWLGVRANGSAGRPLFVRSNGAVSGFESNKLA